MYRNGDLRFCMNAPKCQFPNERLLVHLFEKPRPKCIRHLVKSANHHLAKRVESLPL
jgi:hypothetical protein